MTGARGSTLALFLAILFAVAFLPQVRKPLLQWQLAGLVLGALIYGGVLLSFEAGAASEPGETSGAVVSPPVATAPSEGFYANEDATTSGFLAQSVGRPLLDPMGRNWMWRQTLVDARNHPLLGIGPMNYVCTSPAYIGHPHNFPLQLAAEWGIPAALAVCLLFLALLVRSALYLRRGLTGSAEDRGAVGVMLKHFGPNHPDMPKAADLGLRE